LRLKLLLKGHTSAAPCCVPESHCVYASLRRYKSSCQGPRCRIWVRVFTGLNCLGLRGLRFRVWGFEKRV